jgi:hypothetical protein
MAKAHFFLDDSDTSVCGHRSRVDTEVFNDSTNESDLCALCKKTLQRAWEPA